MSSLDKKTKLVLMLEQLRLTKELLARDDIRPMQRQKYQEEYDILKADIKDMCMEIFNIIRN